MNYNAYLKSSSEYFEMKEEDVVFLARDGDENALNYLINKYRGYVYSKAKSYFLVGGDTEDILQEGMIGLFKAIKDFKCDRVSSFGSFADICITRQIITAIKTATRLKHMPLNSYVSLNKPVYEDDGETTLIDVMDFSGKMSDPEEMIISKEQVKGMEVVFTKVLSKMEKRVLNLYIEGKSHQEISKEINKDMKSVDNALQRVKNKLENIFKDMQ